MRDNASRRALSKKSYSLEKEKGSKEVERDQPEQCVIARVEHVQHWFLIGVRFRRGARVFGLRRRPVV